MAFENEFVLHGLLFKFALKYLHTHTFCDINERGFDLICMYNGMVSGCSTAFAARKSTAPNKILDFTIYIEIYFEIYYGGLFGLNLQEERCLKCLSRNVSIVSSNTLKIIKLSLIAEVYLTCSLI